MFDEYTTEYVAPKCVRTVPEWHARCRLEHLVTHLSEGDTAKVRQSALGTTLMAEYLCGRNAAFKPWLKNMLEAKIKSSPRHEDDRDYTAEDTSLASPQELTLPSREERLADLDPKVNPYLRPIDEMVELGFEGKPYPAKGRSLVRRYSTCLRFSLKMAQLYCRFHVIVKDDPIFVLLHDPSTPIKGVCHSIFMASHTYNSRSSYCI